jgi:hypothetical protein
MLEHLSIMHKGLLFSLGILTWTTIGYNYTFSFVFAQLIPGDFQDANNGNMTLPAPSKASSLSTTRSLTGTQIANAIEKLITSNNNDSQDLELRKIVVENEAKCSSSSLKSTADCNLKIRIHQ